MPATLTTLADILKEFYLGPIQEQLNNEVLCLELFEKVTTDWAGKQVVIPVHLDRNTGVGVSKAGSLPTAGEQTYDQLVVTAENLYGRFQITGDAISAMKSSKGTFAGYVDAEMNKLVNDVRNYANVCTVSGGPVVGFYWSINATADLANAYCGQFQMPDGTAFGTGVEPAGDAANQLVELIDVSFPDGTYDVQPAAGNHKVNAITANSITMQSKPDTSASSGVMAVMAVATTGGASNATSLKYNADPSAGTTTSANSVADDEPTGILGNLCDPTHFGVDRSVAAGANLRSVIKLAGAATTGAASAFGALALDDLQGILDDVHVQSGTSPNLFLMHPSMRVSYTGLLQGTNDGNLRVDSDKAKHGDGGFLSLGYAGVPIKTSRAVPKGIIIAISTKTWKLCELQKGGFADLDGNVLSRVSNEDAYEGYYRWYYNTTCVRPNANGIIAGIDF